MLSGTSILVVDDEPELREILCDELVVSGAGVADANNGQEALLKMRDHVFDVVLSDLRLPGGDGMNFAQQIKSNPDAPLLILMTGYSTSTAKEAYAAS